jgi:hypothetical protein
MELMKPKPSLLNLDETGRALELSISKAIKCFDEMLEMAPSATIMRKYAEFLTEVRYALLRGSCCFRCLFLFFRTGFPASTESSHAMDRSR